MTRHEAGVNSTTALIKADASVYKIHSAMQRGHALMGCTPVWAFPPSGH